MLSNKRKFHQSVTMDYCLVQSTGQLPNTFTVKMPETLNSDKKYEVGVKRISLFPSITNVSGEEITIVEKNEIGETLTTVITNQAGLSFANKIVESSTVIGGIREAYWSIRNKSDKAIEITIPRGFLEKEHSTTVIPAGDTWLGDLNSGVSYPGTVQVKELYIQGTDNYGKISK